jgi:hypothetical protein
MQPLCWGHPHRGILIGTFSLWHRDLLANATLARVFDIVWSAMSAVATAFYIQHVNISPCNLLARSLLFWRIWSCTCLQWAAACQCQRCQR